MTLLDEARGTAQQMVTCLLAGDREGALQLFTRTTSETLLALAMADLCAYVHHRWATAVEIDRHESWRELMLDIAAWAEGIES